MSAPNRPAALILRIGVKPRASGERGLPKPEVESALVTPAGLDGDYNRYRQEKLAGDPDSAVLLVPAELLEALGREGWALRPGDLGENLTTRGIPYEELREGRRLAVGDEVVLELTRLCQPCEFLAVLPGVGPARVAEAVRALVDRRGRYARVVAGGRVRRGDPIVALDGGPGG